MNAHLTPRRAVDRAGSRPVFRPSLMVLAGILAAGCGISGAGTSASPEVRAEIGRYSLRPVHEAGFRDEVRLEGTEAAPRIVVRHRFGIDGVVVVSRDGRWPASIDVRFDGFLMLEDFQAWVSDGRGGSGHLPRTMRGEVRRRITTGEGVVQTDVIEPFGARLNTSVIPEGTAELSISWVDAYRH